MSTSNEHKLDTLHIKQHVKTSSGEGGACLNRHITDYTESSCSHRWQGYRKAQEVSHWYNYPAYHALSTAAHPQGGRYIPDAVQWGHFPAKFLRPKPGDWDLGSSSFNGRYPNFQKWSKAPYWHQAHHLIPNSVMQECIANAAKTDMRLFWLVRSSLLEAKYNLNHKENVVILPMGKTVADVLGLPRHITGIEGQPGSNREFTNHAAYSDKVKGKVNTVILRFANQIKSKEHDIEAGEFARDSLEAISQTLFMKLRVYAQTAKGLSLSEYAPYL